MTDTKYSMRFLIGAAFATGAITLVGCGSPERVTKTTTTEQTTTTPMVAPVSSSTTTTTTQQTRP